MNLRLFRMLFFVFLTIAFSIVCPQRSNATDIEQQLIRLTFEKESHGFRSGNRCRAFLRGGSLFVEADGDHPTLSRLVDEIGGQIRCVVKIRTQTESTLSLYWMMRSSPRRSDDKMAAHPLIADGNWHEYEFLMTIPDALTGITLRFGASEGMWEIKEIRAYRQRKHPLSVKELAPYRLTNPDGKDRDMLRYTIQNDAPVPLAVKIGNMVRKIVTEPTTPTDEEEVEFWYGIITPKRKPKQPETDEDSEYDSETKSNEIPDKNLPPSGLKNTQQPEIEFQRINEITIPARQSIDLLAPIKTSGNLASTNLLLHPKYFPSIGFSVFRYVPEGKTDWISRPLGPPSAGRTFDIAPNAEMARIRKGDEILAIIAPIAHYNASVPEFRLSENSSMNQFRFEAPDARLEIQVDGDSLVFRIAARNVDLDDDDEVGESKAQIVSDPKLPRRMEGPVVRLVGKLQGGLLSGVEFLGHGDVSSSVVDIAEPDNDRSVPNPNWITMPLAVLETEKIAARLRWNDMKLQPTFSTPNRFDWADDHRMSLIGSEIEATVEFFDPEPIGGESATLISLRKHVTEQNFPQWLTRPRTPEEQRRFCLAALRGGMQSEDGERWGYALEPVWPREPFADVLSTLFRLTGRVPDPKTIVPGGSDIANDAVYFLTGRIEEWKNRRERAIRNNRSLQNPDGSFLYRTRFPEVEQSATSYGYTAVQALEIMEHVRLTGNDDLFNIVQKSLEYLRRCQIPRGGFYRDAPLHTPDLQTVASTIWLAVWAYEYSGNEDYLRLADRFAHLGLPFVYQWSNRDIMLYTTVPCLGGKERRQPLWFGVSQTRVGINYAYALHLLAKHAPEKPWRKIAVGILHATERMQYIDGPEAGCVPDVFAIQSQERRSWKTNPCALLSLRYALEGELDSLSVTLDGKNRYVSPFSLRLTSAGLEAINVPSGCSFQILHNGSRIITATGSGPIID